MLRGQRGPQFQAAQALRGLARPGVDIARMGISGGVGVEPKALAEAIQGTKDVEEKIDLSLELLDIAALNTGKHHAMVVQDPEDKRNIQGFCRLAVIYSRAIYPDKYPKFDTELCSEWSDQCCCRELLRLLELGIEADRKARGTTRAVDLEAPVDANDLQP